MSEKLKRRMRFQTWCKKDPQDETKIVYTFKAPEKTYHFTSESTVSPAMLERIRNAWVESIERVDGEWIAVLYE